MTRGAKVFPIQFCVNRRARRYILRVALDGSARVTIPRGGSRREARRFIARHLDWIERERYLRLRDPIVPRPWVPGSCILLRGEPVSLFVSEAGGEAVVSFGAYRIRLASAPLDLRPLVQKYLRRLALDELPRRLRQLAEIHRLSVARVTVRNQRSRWGSCSGSGSIALNWRLVQMPDAVRDYVLVHELVHLREPNHSRRFWRLVEEACPGHREARAWLKAHENELM